MAVTKHVKQKGFDESQRKLSNRGYEIYLLPKSNHAISVIYTNTDQFRIMKKSEL